MSRIVVRVRNRILPEDFSFNIPFKEAIKAPKARSEIPGYGIITATDYKAFVGFQFCYSSICLTHQVPVAVFDLGMNDKQREWCRRQKDLILLKYRSPFGYQIDWKKWHKPLFFWNSPFKKTIWIDSDAVLCGNLNTILAMYGDQPFFTIDTGNNPPDTLNPDGLYSIQPAGSYLKDEPPYLNAGFMIMDKDRDLRILQDWCYLIIEAFTNMQVANVIKLHDQGTLKWAIQRHDKVNCIIQDARYNYGARDRNYAYKSTVEAALIFLRTLSGMAKDAFIVHWLGVPKPWFKWGEMINLDYTKA